MRIYTGRRAPNHESDLPFGNVSDFSCRPSSFSSSDSFNHLPFLLILEDLRDSARSMFAGCQSFSKAFLLKIRLASSRISIESRLEIKLEIRLEINVCRLCAHILAKVSIRLSINSKGPGRASQTLKAEELFEDSVHRKRDCIITLRGQLQSNRQLYHFLGV